MTKPTRPEIAAFLALGVTAGWKVSPHNDAGEVRFNIETSPADEVTLILQDHGRAFGGLGLDLWMYPEDELRDATPQQMAATVARWLRDTAAKLEAVAGERG